MCMNQAEGLIARSSGEFALAPVERRYRDSQVDQELRHFRLIWSLTLSFFLFYAAADLLLYPQARSAQLLLLRGAIDTNDVRIASAALLAQSK